MSAHRSVTALVTALLVCAAAPARADGDKPDFESARAHYRAGQSAAGAGRWDEAAAEYAAAYALTGDPVIHFRIADAYEHAGDCERALEHYERYVEDAAPPEAYAELALRRVNACQDVILAAREADAAGADDETDEADATRPESRPGSRADAEPEAAAGPDSGGEADRAPPSEPSDESPAGAPVALQGDSWQRGAAWTSTGLAVVFAATSGILAASASAREDDLERLMRARDPDSGAPPGFDGHTRERYDSLVREGENLALASRIALGAAGAATAAAITLFLIDPGPRARAPALAPIRPGRGVGLAAGWEF